MQVIEILLKSSPITVYSEDLSHVKGEYVVVEYNESEELGIVKDKIQHDPDCEFVKVLRTSTEQDKTRDCENCRYARSLLPEIKKSADKLGLDMKIGLVSSSLDRSKLIINYTADERVDFRELVKILGSKYKTRIEMKQIGNRDETKAIGAMGICGRVCCCKAFLSDFEKVSIKMAKNQNIALNPTRINGMCGRLLCCLKYEDEFYADMQNKMPKLNSVVTTPDGKGQVTATDFLKETVTVTFTKDDSTEVKIYDIKDITFKKQK